MVKRWEAQVRILVSVGTPTPLVAQSDGRTSRRSSLMAERQLSPGTAGRRLVRPGTSAAFVMATARSPHHASRDQSASRSGTGISS
jgi:hypothetical protein